MVNRLINPALISKSLIYTLHTAYHRQQHYFLNQPLGNACVYFLVAGKDKKPKSETTNGWYSNLKKQFEKLDEEFEKQPNAKEPSRLEPEILIKAKTEAHKMAAEDTKETRHYFSRLVRSNKSLIDEELPDPDKVQNIRAMFQESLNSKLKKKLGGSLQNINMRAEHQLARPMSAEGNREDMPDKFAQTEEKEVVRTEKSETEIQTERNENRQIELEKEPMRLEDDNQSMNFGNHDLIKRGKKVRERPS